MDLSSQVQFIQNGKSSAEQVLPELNHEAHSKCTTDEKVPENDTNLGNHKSIEASNKNPNYEPEDPTRKNSSPRREHMEMEDTRPYDPTNLQKSGPLTDDASKYSNLDQLETTQEDELKKLSEQGNKKRGRPSKRQNVFTGNPRVPRTRLRDKSKTSELVNAPAQNVGSKETKRRKNQIKKIPNNEYSKIKTHLRYLLNRMNYEQNFIDAYVGEGWKGQSLEKIKPEKELERAKSDILRYKLKIRDLFQRIDTSCAEGRLPESLFDSEGLIDSEDIFCAKCGQQDVRLDNDIILCDGACERGFHQFCLEPPLLKEQVPPGDEGWLCPACDCKIDCINLLNDSCGTDLSINDSWEKVFSEAAASGNKLDDISRLPSDDSEDDDYNPGDPKVDDEMDEEESSADESEFSSAFEDLGAAESNEQNLGFPSEDSEDDDYNPDKLGSDKQATPESSSSDFMSDSEDLSNVYKIEGRLAEVQEPSTSDHVKNNEESPKSFMEADRSEPITAKRHLERLDYKKLHDETYGTVSSDSSDENFSDADAPRWRKHTKGAENLDLHQNQLQSESALERNGIRKLDVDGTSGSLARKRSSALGSSNSSRTKAAYKRLGEAATQRLYETFKENQYPNPELRENLAKELNLTVNQVRKWFENARWSFNHPGTRTKSLPESGTSTPAQNAACVEVKTEQPKVPSTATTVIKQANKESPKTPRSRKRKAEADHQDTETSSPSPKPEGVRRSGRFQPTGGEKPAS